MRTVRRVVRAWTAAGGGLTLLDVRRVPLELDAQGRCAVCHDTRIIGPPPGLNKSPAAPCRACRDEG